jgi:Yip1 domain
MAVPELPVTQEEQGSFAGDLVGMFNFFIDPAGAAKLIRHKWFWVGPVVLLSIVGIVIGILVMPIVQQVLLSQPPPPGQDPAQYQKGLAIGLAIQRYATYCSPILVVILIAISAAIVLASCSVMQIKTKFLWLFNLLAGVSLINLLQSIATYLIIKGKGEINTPAELQPPLGLDIFMGEGTNKFLTAFVGYFSVFQIWYIVMLVLVFAAAFKVSKGKALAAVAPLLILTLLLKLGGAAFQR